MVYSSYTDEISTGVTSYGDEVYSCYAMFPDFCSQVP